jgi:hypothetical protein
VWDKWFRNKIVPVQKYSYDGFVNTGTQGEETKATGSECMDTCTSDAQCTAYTTRSDNPSFCSTFHGDPAKDWTFSDASPQTLFVKRFSTDPPLTWTGWGDCDQPCGGGIKKRVCSSPDKCPGPTSEACNSQVCDSMLPQMSNTKPYPDQSGVESDVPLPMHCVNKCLSDPTCTGIIYRRNVGDLPTPIHCTTFSGPIDELQSAPESTDTTAFQVKAPAGSYGVWAPFPSCPCGTDKVERACSDPSGNPCAGPKYFKCTNVPCAYDPFPGASM